MQHPGRRQACALGVLTALAVSGCTSAGGAAGPATTSSTPTTARPTSPATSTPSKPTAPVTSAASSSSTGSGFPASRARAAVAYAKRQGMDSSVALVDLHTGVLTTAGDADRLVPTASVIKTLIATQVLLNGQMHGRDAELAYTMITRSDNDDAYALYPQVGGDALLPKLARHYRIGDLGRRPAFAGFWGSTRITAPGLARFYAAVRADPKVWPWLSNAMRHHQPTTTAGEPNDFGLADLDGTAVKNGWNTGRDKNRPGDCQINTTGFVDDHRYAVVVLSEGPGRLYSDAGERVVTRQAHLLFPDA